jgi:hypothetical protein
VAVGTSPATPPEVLDAIVASRPAGDEVVLALLANAPELSDALVTKIVARGLPADLVELRSNENLSAAQRALVAM